MIRRVIATDNDMATTILRLALGVIFFAHGAQKTFGWFGGYGFTGTMGFFTGMLHIPTVFAFLAIAAEFFGGLGLIFGLFTRVAAFGISCNMIVAVAMVHHQFGFFMNWTGAQKPRRTFAPRTARMPRWKATSQRRTALNEGISCLTLLKKLHFFFALGPVLRAGVDQLR